MSKSVASSAVSSVKTLEQRQHEYDEARKRIFEGLVDDTSLNKYTQP